MAKKVMKKSAPKLKKDANQKQTKPVKEPKPFKKPASLPFDPPKEEGMSLEAKIVLFRKRKGDDVGAFLKSLSKDQREALWQRFAHARGSEPKKKLLGAFLKNGTLKGCSHYMKELVALSKTSGERKESSWVPFNKMKAVWIAGADEEDP